MRGLLIIVILTACVAAADLAVSAEDWIEAVMRTCEGSRHVVLRPAGDPGGEDDCEEIILVRLPPGAEHGIGALHRSESGWLTAGVGAGLQPPEKPGWPKIFALLQSATVALAQLGRDNRLATVFSLFDGTVHAFLPDGTTVPGWSADIGDDVATPMPAAADLDDDGLDEIIVPLVGLHALSPTGSYLPGWPVFELDHGFNGKIPAAPIFTPGEPRRIIAQAGMEFGGGALFAFDSAGQVLPGWPAPVHPNGAAGNAAVGDITGDGVAEVVGTLFSSSGGPPSSMGRIVAYDQSGVLVPGFPVSMGLSLQEPTLGDLDGDGAMGIVFAGSPIEVGVFGAGVMALRGDGTPVPGWPQRGGPASNWGVALGDVDHDGRLELATATVNNAGLPSFGRVNLWNDDGTYLPGWPVLVQNVGFPGPVVIADVDGNGAGDVMAGGTSVVAPISGVIYAWTAQGTLIPGFPITIPGRPIGSATAPTVADIDGDGMAELGVMSETGLFLSPPTRVHWFNLGVPYHPEGMEWPTRAHDMARTGAYSPPVKALEMTARVVPLILAEFLPAPPLRVVVRVSPNEERRPEKLFLVAVDGEAIEPVQGEPVPIPHRRPAGALRQVFRFDGEAVKDLLEGPGLHTLTFRSEVISLGFGGARFEGEGRVFLLGLPRWWDDGVGRPSGTNLHQGEAERR